MALTTDLVSAPAGRAAVFQAVLLLGCIQASPVAADGQVYANGREIACKTASGKVIAAFPDVCFTPPRSGATPPGVPIPYPNTGVAADTERGSEKVKSGAKKARVKSAAHGTASGGADGKGASKPGAISGKTFFQTFDIDVKIEGKNCVRHLSIPTGNSASAGGALEPIALQQNASGQSFLRCDGSLFATTIIPAPPPSYTLVDAQLHEGVIFDVVSPHEEELILDGSEGPTLEQIQAAEEKVREYVAAHPDEGGFAYQKTVGGTANDGRYEIEARYGTSKVPNIYAARFDIDGNLIGRPGITPAGRVQLTIKGAGVKGDDFKATTLEDIHGNKYTAKVVFGGGRGYYLFNEQGQAYLGEVYDAVTGERSGAGLNPDYFPVLADHGEPLVEGKYVQLAQTRCPIPCQAVTDVYNSIAAEINLTVQRMGMHAAEHKKGNAEGLAAEAQYEQAMLAGSKANGRAGPEPGTPVSSSVVQKNRGRYEGLAETLEVLQKKLAAARRNLDACTCPGEVPGPLQANALWPEPYSALPDNAQPCLQQLAALDWSSQRGGQSNDDENIIVVQAKSKPASLELSLSPVCDGLLAAIPAQAEVREQKPLFALTSSELKEKWANAGRELREGLKPFSPRPTDWVYSASPEGDIDLPVTEESLATWNVHSGALSPESSLEHYERLQRQAAPALILDEGGVRFSQGSFNAVTDQWWLQRIASPEPAAQSTRAVNAATTVVAVIDSGADVLHPGLIGHIWANPGEIPGNGLDDDDNGLVDDINGWNFVRNNNDVRDTNGHGTLVAGIIAGQGLNNGTHGIDPGAQVMVLKVTNFAGRGNSIDVAAAVSYAVEHGAKVINISLGGTEFSAAEGDAITYATAKGALVVIAAGNQGADAAEFWPAAVPGAVTVGAAGPDDARADYSNWGEPLDLTAPGTDIVALRARYTDPMLIGEGKYEPGSNIAGDSGMLYRATGTSFAAPMVAGAVSRALAHDPTLTVAELRRMLLYSARDLGTPGPDILTGYGMLQVATTLNADPAFFIEARISGVQIARRDGKTFVQVLGSADADEFVGATLRMGAGANPNTWQEADTPLEQPLVGGILAELDAQLLAAKARWTLQLEVRHANGSSRLGQFDLKLR